MKKIYFISDLHLGTPSEAESSAREKLFLQWLDEIFPTTEQLFLVGDIFDFWFEYKQAIPKGFTRTLAAIAKFTDAGIPVHFFTGNHDMWIFDYFEKELGVKMYRKPVAFFLQGKQVLVGHGDGLGPGDYKYKFIKKVFANPFFQWLFSWVHPDIGIGVANFFSRKSRYGNGEAVKETFLGKENEWLYIYCKEVLEQKQFDYFIFGHRHLPLELPIENKNSIYINLGDWLHYYTYAEMSEGNLSLKTYKNTVSK